MRSSGEDSTMSQEHLLKEIEILRSQVSELEHVQLRLARTEQELRQSEERVRHLYENIPLGYLSLDEHGCVVEVNKVWLDTFGYAREEAIGKWFGDFLSPDLLEAFRHQFSSLQDTGEIHWAGFEMARKDCTKVEVVFDGQIGRDASGTFKRVHCIIRDIVEMSQSRDVLLERERYLSTLMSNLPGMAYRCLNDRAWTMKFVSEGCFALTGYCAEDLLDNARLSFADLIHSEDRARVWDEVQKCLSKRKSFQLEYRIETASRQSKWVWEQGRGVYNPACEVVALEGFITDITNQKQADDDLRESRRKYRNLFDEAPVGIFQSTVDGKVLRVNPAYAQMYGYGSAEEAAREIDNVGRRIYAEPERRKMLIDLAMTVDGFVKAENQYRRKDGSLFEGQLYFRVVRDRDGEVKHLEGYVEDITDRKKAEKALAESEARYRGVFENAAIGIDVVDAKGRFVKVNGALLQMLGYSEDELLNLTIFDISHPEDVEVSKAYHEQMLRGDTDSYQFEKRYVKKNGEAFWADVSVSPVRAPDGSHIATVGVIADISNRKLAERALLASEQKYRALFEESFDGLFITSPGGKILDMNKKGVAMFGYDTKEEVLSLDLERDVYAYPPDRKRILATIDAQGSAEYEVIVKKKNGEEMITHCSLTAVKDEQGVITSYRGIIRDITELAQVRLRLESERARLRTLVQTIPDLVWLKDPEGVYLACNPRFEHFFGAKEADIIGKTDYDFVDADLADFFREHDRRAIDAGKPSINEEWITFADDGHRELLETTKTPMYDKDASLIGVLGISRNITAAREAKEALQEASSYNRSLIEASLDPLVTISAKGNITDVNSATEEVTGYYREELIGTDFANYFTDPQKSWEGCQRAFTEGMVKDYELQIRHRDGHLTAVLFNASVYRDRSGEIVGLFAAARDITERKISEELIHVRVNLLEFAASHPLDELLEKTLDEIGVLTNSPIGFYHFVEDDQITLSLQAWSTLTIREFCKADGKGQHYPIDRAGVWVDCIREGKPVIHNDYSSLPHRKGMPKGHASIIRELVVPIIRSGQIVAVLGIGNKPSDYTDRDVEMVAYLADVAWEITSRKRAQQAMKESEEQYRTLFEDSIDGVYSVLRDGTITDANTAFCRLFGYSSEEMIGKDIRELYLDPTDRPRFQEEIEKRGFVKDDEVRFQKKDGTEVDCLLSSSVHFENDGHIIGYRGILRDLTARKALQRQLLQAQKMEAIGTLAGGIAHDFNNLLQVTLGYSELLLSEKSSIDPDYADLQKIRQAACSGAELVKNLLTFSRKSEPSPIAMDLNKKIWHVEKLLHRTIPKMIDIRLDLTEDLARINADPAQIEQILMNLALNAKDAMGEHGSLKIRTETVTLGEEYCRFNVEAKPGDYVLLSVSDTGHGMDKETLQHIFEPFYTTKELGRGTGLGLAMVYGIVRQHGGHIDCYSEVGKGTTFRLYFPALPSVEEPAAQDSGLMPAFGTETVLLVDDEAFVRELGARILTKQGYTVLQAGNGKEAVDLFKREGSRISLVILDLIMPEMGGKDCLKSILEIDPHVKALIASGYSADASTKECFDLGAKGFVAKPFRFKELLQQVRKALDQT
jgi:two-component system, cell cycle sensor histidine kinase and response regulator CckA